MKGGGGESEKREREREKKFMVRTMQCIQLVCQVREGCRSYRYCILMTNPLVHLTSLLWTEKALTSLNSCNKSVVLKLFSIRGLYFPATKNSRPPSLSFSVNLNM